MDLYTNYMLQFENESLQEIGKIVSEHNLSLNRCAEIIGLIAPVADLFGPDGAVNWLKKAIEKDGLLA